MIRKDKKSKGKLTDELSDLWNNYLNLKSSVAKQKCCEEEFNRQKRAFQVHFDFEEEVAHLQVDRIVGEALAFVKKRTDISRVSIALLDKKRGGLRLLDVLDELDWGLVAEELDRPVAHGRVGAAGVKNQALFRQLFDSKAK